MKVGIIGLGHVGTAMHNLFKDAIVYDKFKNIGTMDDINNCDAAFICVPTPMSENGSCDTTAVDEVLSWCNCKVLIIRSTVRVGYTREMAEKLHKNFPFKRTRVYFDLIKVIKPEEYEEKNTVKLGEEIGELMLKTINSHQKIETEADVSDDKKVA